MRASAVERAPEKGPYQPPTFAPLPRTSLHGFERYSVALGEGLNTRSSLKRAAASFGYHVPRNFVTWASRKRWRIYGLENMAGLRPERGVILVSNHRSFFDMYVAAASIFAHADFIERLYFPVRSKFFYDNPLGAVVNFVMSGYAMWPPMFRDERKGELNSIGIQQMAYALSTRGAVLGLHPEGTRQKGNDPYVLGPARPGVGRLIQQCDPNTVVLPFFILGLSNDFLREVRLGLRRTPDPAIRMHWAPGIRCGELLERCRDAQSIADELLRIVHGLGQRDRMVEARAEGATAQYGG